MPTIFSRLSGPPVPKYRRHKASGQAVVTLSGRDFYLGRYGSKASRVEYDRLIAEWLAGGRQVKPAAGVELTVSELLARYWAHVDVYYPQPSGEPERIKQALKPVRKLYGATPAAEFGPLALKAVRQRWIDQGLSRLFINQRVGRIRRMFKWAVAEELLPPRTFQALQAVEGLRFGHTDAVETQPVGPVPEAWVDEVLAHLPPTLRAMVQVQRLAGMRPAEVCSMRPCDIDVSGEVWIYKPQTHKTAWRGHQRLIPLGPRVQAIIRPFMGPKLDQHLFRPSQAVAERNAAKRAARRSRVQPSQIDRRKGRPKKQPGDYYDTRSYWRAVRYAIERAGCPQWHPHQLRHAHATEVRRTFGIEGSQAALGHASLSATQVYAQKRQDLAVEIARKIG